MSKIKIKRGNRNVIPSNLETGELFLILDENKLSIKNDNLLIELPNSTEIQSLTNQLNSLVKTVNTISSNIVQLNQDVEGKISSPESPQLNQFLKYDGEKWIASDITGTGNSIIISPTQPEQQEVSGLWLKELTV